MNSGPLPLFFLAFTIGLALSRCSRAIAIRLWLAVCVVAAVATFVVVPARLSLPFELTLWVVTALLATTVFVPKRLGGPIVIVLTLAGGLCLGVVATISASRILLLPALLSGLVFLPIQALSSKGSGIAAKVVASWMIAIGTLVLLASMVPTPGYRQDHME